MDNDTSTCLYLDYFESHTPGIHILLVTATAMTIIFLYSAIHVISNVILMCRKRGQLLFYNTRFVFYIFFLIFCLARGFFFGAQVVRETFTSSAQHTLADRVIDFVCNGIYHVGSTFFYSGFFYLSLYSAEVYLFVNGMGPPAASKAFRVPKFLIIGFISFLVLVQFIFNIAITASVVSKTDFSFAPIFEKCQLVFHCTLSGLSVLFFVLFIGIARSKLLPFLVYRTASSYHFKFLFTTLVFLSILLILKAAANVGLFVLGDKLCPNTRIMLISVLGIPLDVVPIAFVLLGLGQPTFDGEEVGEQESLLPPNPLQSLANSGQTSARSQQFEDINGGEHDDLRSSSSSRPVSMSSTTGETKNVATSLFTVSREFRNNNEYDEWE